MKLYLYKKKIDEKNIIGIFDLDRATEEKATRVFMKKKEEEKKVDEMNPLQLPLSLIVYRQKQENRISFSRLRTGSIHLKILRRENSEETEA